MPAPTDFRLIRATQKSCASVALVSSLAGCATVEPTPLDKSAFKERAETKIQDDLKVTVAVPTRDEAKNIYGVDLGSKVSVLFRHLPTVQQA